MDESSKTTAFSDLYQLMEEGEALLAQGNLDAALAKYRQAARIVPGGSQAEEQIALTIQSILRAKKSVESGGPAVVQKIPGSGYETHVVADPYQGSYQPQPAQDNWGISPAWGNQPAQPPAAPYQPPPAAVPPTYAVPAGAVPPNYAAPGGSVPPTYAVPGPASAPSSYPAGDPYSYPFDQAMEAINYGDWPRAESLLTGIVTEQPYYTRNGVTAQDALVHVRNQMTQAAPPTAMKKWGIPAIIGGGLALAFCAIAGAAGLFGYFIAKPPTPTPTLPISAPANLAPSPTLPVVSAPTYTLPPTYTPLPTYTPPPTDTRQPPQRPTQPPPPTQRPAPTEAPAANCCTLRVRNHASHALWIGTNMPYGGNTIKPNWYIDFHLTGAQSVTIWYCDVRADGNQVNCRTTTFQVSETLQEEQVP